MVDERDQKDKAAVELANIYDVHRPKMRRGVLKGRRDGGTALSGRVLQLSSARAYLCLLRCQQRLLAIADVLGGGAPVVVVVAVEEKDVEGSRARRRLGRND